MTNKNEGIRADFERVGRIVITDVFLPLMNIFSGKMCAFLQLSFPVGFSGGEQLKSGKFSKEVVETETPRKTAPDNTYDDGTASVVQGAETNAAMAKKRPFSLPWYVCMLKYD